MIDSKILYYIIQDKRALE